MFSPLLFEYTPFTGAFGASWVLLDWSSGGLWGLAFPKPHIFKFTASVRKKGRCGGWAPWPRTAEPWNANGPFLECGLVSVLSSLSLLAAIKRWQKGVRICVVTFSVCKFKMRVFLPALSGHGGRQNVLHRWQPQGARLLISVRPLGPLRLLRPGPSTQRPQGC